MKKIWSVILVVVMVFSIVSCGAKKNDEGKEPSNLVGEWTGMFGEGDGGIMSSPSDLTLSFKEDGTGTLKYFSSTTDFEWEEKDGKVICTYLDEEFIELYRLETYEATIEGDTLTGGHLYGFDFIVAKNGTDAADPSLYGSEE